MATQRNGSVFILGATGQIGSALRAIYADRDVVAPPHAEVPIEDFEALETAIERHRPDLLVNCTAFHQLDECERRPAEAFRINAEAVGFLAKLCGAKNVRFATISTDYVFSGLDDRSYEETDCARPLNVYGVSKLAGEQYALNVNPESLVFRVSAVFGPSGFSNKGPTFVERMIGLAETNQPIRVVDNIVFSPSYTIDVAATMRQLLDAGETGIYHVTNAGSCSWYDLASAAIEAAGLTAEITRTTYSNEGANVKRPIHSVLEHSALKRKGYASPRPWRLAVDAYVEERKRRLLQAR